MQAIKTFNDFKNFLYETTMETDISEVAPLYQLIYHAGLLPDFDAWRNGLRNL